MLFRRDKGGNSQQALAITEVNEDEDLLCHSRSRAVKRQLNSRNISKIEQSGFPSGWSVGCERSKSHETSLVIFAKAT